MSAPKTKKPEDICQILISRINDSLYLQHLTRLSKSKDWSKNGLSNQIDRLSYLCDIIQEENKIIKQLINCADSSKEAPARPIGSSKPIFGIDLGTSRSTIGYYRIDARGRSDMDIVANQQGSRSIPSVVCFYKNEVYFGDNAIKMSAKCPENLIYDTKRMLGRKYNDEYIKYMSKYWTFNIVPSNQGDILIEVEKKTYRPYEISAMILVELMNMANNHLKEKTNEAIITIPAYFTEDQREETKKAAKKAGIKLLDLVEEPKAATFCYGFKTEDAGNANKSRDILVYDFGGGTLDVSYVEIKGSTFTVLGMDGDSLLGGQDFTNCLFEYISPTLDKVCKKDWRNDHRFLSYVRNLCDEAKIYLSDQDDYDFYFDIPDKFQKNNNSYLEFTITRKEFEKAANCLFERCMNPVITVIRNVGRDPRRIDGLVLIGGSSYLPMIRNKLKEITQKDAFHGVCPVEAVAYGACTIASKFLQGSMPKYIKNDSNSDMNEKFLSNMTVHEGICQSKIELEKFKNNLPYYEPIFEEGTPLPACKESLVLSKEVQIPKNAKELSLRVMQVQKNTRICIGCVKFDISQYSYTSQNVPLANIRFTQNKTGLFYSAQKPSSKSWPAEKKLDKIEDIDIEKKKKKNDVMNRQDAYQGRVSSEPIKKSNTRNNDTNIRTNEYQNSSNIHSLNPNQTPSANNGQYCTPKSMINEQPSQQYYTGNDRRHETFPEPNNQRHNQNFHNTSDHLGLNNSLGNYQKNDIH